MVREVLCTLGPASYNASSISRLSALGISLFRINLSHTPYDDVENKIALIRKYSSVPICLDTEGAQIRTGNFIESVNLRENSFVRVHADLVPGDSKDFNFYPQNIVKELKTSDFISIDFNSVLTRVVAFEGENKSVAILRVINGGMIGKNKAVTVDRDLPLPVLSKKDRAAIELGRKLGIRHVALSFANFETDVDEVRRLAGPGTFIISKIECLKGLLNLSGIAEKSDALLIDRGDLSRQVPIEQLPRAQKAVIETGKLHGKKVYVATNLFESMITNSLPTRAEVNDVYNTLLDGADGLVLAAETAIGAFPLRSASMAIKMIREFERPESAFSSRPYDQISLLPDPHGGHLIQRLASSDEELETDHLPRIEVSETDLMDCEQIAVGTYSPLSGFMGLDTLEEVLAHNRLPDGQIWTMPMLLQVAASATACVGKGSRIALASRGGAVHSIMDVEEVYTYPLDKLSLRWFGTSSRSHPGVARLHTGGDTFLAGKITLVRRLSTGFGQFDLSPSQSRFIFSHKGWSRVVGFHTRNPPHQSHEFIQLSAMDRVHADGLFIAPVVGPKKSGDVLPELVLECYRRLIDFGIYPAGKALLGSSPTYARYCGPREAVFTAISHKNRGCSHFIVGRDHTGVGQFYERNANKALFEKLGDIGIDIVFFDEVAYDPDRRQYREMEKPDGAFSISGTQVRTALNDNTEIPSWLMRDIVQDVLRTEIGAGRNVFVA